MLKINISKSRLIYGIVSGIIYATTMSIFDYFQDKTFDFKKFIIGAIIFGIAMMIVFSFKNKKK